MMYIEFTPLEENLQHILDNNAPSSETTSILARVGAPEQTFATQLPLPAQAESAANAGTEWGVVTGAKIRTPDFYSANNAKPTHPTSEEEEFSYELIDIVEDDIVENKPNGRTPQASVVNSRSDIEINPDICIEIEEAVGENCYIIRCSPKATESGDHFGQHKSFENWKTRNTNQTSLQRRGLRPVPAAIPIRASIQLRQKENGYNSSERDFIELLPPAKHCSSRSSVRSVRYCGEYCPGFNRYSSERESEAGFAGDYLSEDRINHEQDSSMGINIVAKLRRLLNLQSDSNCKTSEEEEPSRKRRSGYWASDVNPTQIKYRRVQNRFPKVITHALDDDDVELITTSSPRREKQILLEKPLGSSMNSMHMIQRKPSHTIEKSKLRKSMFTAPSVTHKLVRNTSYADVEFSDDDEPELIQGFGIEGRVPLNDGRRKGTTYNIPASRCVEGGVNASIKPPPPLIEARTGSILASSLLPSIDAKHKPISSEAVRGNLQVPSCGLNLGQRSSSSVSSSGASTSASVGGVNGFSHMRSNLWSTNARSILTQEKETEEHEKYQQLLEQVVPCLYAADAGNARQAIENPFNCEGPQRRRALLTSRGAFTNPSTPRIAHRRSLALQSDLQQQLKRLPLSSTINLDDDDDADVTFAGIVQADNRLQSSDVPKVIIDDDEISEIVDLREDEQNVVSTCVKLKNAAIWRSDLRRETQMADKSLPYVEPINTLQERFRTSPHLKNNWLEAQQTKWTEKRKNLFEEVKETVHVVEKLSAERRAAELEMHERLRKIQIVDPDLLVIDDFPEPSEDDTPEFIELTVEHQDRIKRAICGSPDEVLISKFNLNITRRDIHTLLGHNWLNDEVINFYMNLLTERGEKKHESHGLPRVYAMNTFFVPRLLLAGHSGVKRWTRKVDIFSKDVIPVPVHVGGVHWCMAIIHLKNRSIKYYDSMGTPNPNVLKALEQYLKDESMDKRKQPFDTSRFEIESVRDVPRQMNGSDCGVFSCMFAEYITRNREISFTQQNMEYFRHKMILEIVQGELLH